MDNVVDWLVGILMAIFAWVAKVLHSKVEDHEKRLRSIEIDDAVTDTKLDGILEKLDELNDTLKSKKRTRQWNQRTSSSQS